MLWAHDLHMIAEVTGPGPWGSGSGFGRTRSTDSDPQGTGTHGGDHVQIGLAAAITVQIGMLWAHDLHMIAGSPPIAGQPEPQHGAGDQRPNS